MMQAVDGSVPERAQQGIKPTLAAQNYFLSCACYPEEDLTVALPEQGLVKVEARVSGIERLNSDILGIRLRPARPFNYRAGQFINFFKDDATVRCYSLASVPTVDDELFLHVRKVPNGVVSGWMFENLKAGDGITISEATGDCFYVPGAPQQSIMLIGTGSGLAPLYGITRDALLNGHSGPIRLYHGGYTADALYMVDELRKLAAAHPNFSYLPCVSDGDAPQGYAKGVVLDVALRENPDLTGWRVFLCGNPNMVNAAKRDAFLAGASVRDIFADPF
jgi:NAD(P)H-flavin reductase